MSEKDEEIQENIEKIRGFVKKLDPVRASVGDLAEAAETMKFLLMNATLLSKKDGMEVAENARTMFVVLRKK